MVDLIISPWVVYIVTVLAKINFAAYIVLMVSLFALAIMGLFLFLDIPYNSENFTTLKKAFKYTVLTSIISLVLAIFVPEQNALIAIIGASYVTPDNIQAVQGNIVDFVHQIAEAIK